MVLILDFRNKTKSNFGEKLKDFCGDFEEKGNQQLNKDNEQNDLEDA